MRRIKSAGIFRNEGLEWNVLSTLALQAVNYAISLLQLNTFISFDSPEGTRPPTPKSDTELELVRQKEFKHELKPLSRSSSTDKIEWNWGELPEVSLLSNSEFLS